MTIHLHFLGAARNVTGSRHLLEVGNKRVLIDCGLYQERELRSRNYEPFVIDPKSIDAVVLTHGHLDHCGLLPKLVREGFAGNVYCTPVTAEIVPIVLYDSAHLMAEDAKYKAKRHRRENRGDKKTYEPLYRPEDVDSTMALFQPIDYRTPFAVAAGIEGEFRDAGHILGSSMARLTVADGTTTRQVLFSGDVGRWGRPILQDPDLFEEADCLVIESTYGDRVHADEKSPDEALREILSHVLDGGGNLVIPSFAIERAQEILYVLARLKRAKAIPNMNVFLDSPMAIKVTEVLRKHAEIFDAETIELVHQGRSPFSFQGLKMSRATEESKAINRIVGSCIIIAGSGMCTGGRIKHHLVHNISRPESCILFVGYQATGTLGRHILEGGNPVRILGSKREVRARIHQIHGFSGHGDCNDLLRCAQALKAPPKQVFVVHGGEHVSARFTAKVQETLGCPATNPAYREIATLA